MAYKSRELYCFRMTDWLTELIELRFNVQLNTEEDIGDDLPNQSLG